MSGVPTMMVRAALLSCLAAGCGSRSAVRPEIGDGGEGEGEGASVSCTEACAQAFATCPSGLDFDMEDCVARCEDQRVFDDCTPECGADCGCIRDCYVGDPLTCGGYCKWLAVNECSDLDVAACGQGCRTNPDFTDCTFGCSRGNCLCLMTCF